jgi:hypothetical protein
MVSAKVTLTIAAVGVIFAWWFASNKHTACVSENVVLTAFSDVTINMDPCHVFSDTYLEARALFRQAALDAGCELHALPVYENYTIDIAVLRGGTTALLPGLTVHTSGVHGVEGYAGSAVQIAFLKAITETRKEKENLELPTIILVHAFNPVGMAHYRRTNEANVDLNRNALTPAQWQTYANNHYNRANYDRFDTYLFNPARAPTFFSCYIEFWVRAFMAIQRYGLAALKAAMVGGQYHNPRGIFYGGTTTVEPSIGLVEEFLKEYLSQHEEISTQVVTWIDVHTGLGKSGEDTIMTTPKSSIWPDKDPASELATWFPDSHSPYDTTSAAAANVVQGYSQVQGVTPDYFERLLFTADQKPLLSVQEFGTKPTVLVGHALVIENMAHHYSDAAMEWAQRTTRRAFYPDNALWRRQVLERGVRALWQATKRSSQLSKQLQQSQSQQREQPVPEAEAAIAE